LLELLDRDHPLTEDGIRQASDLNNRWKLAALHHQDHDDDDDDDIGGDENNDREGDGGYDINDVTGDGVITSSTENDNSALMDFSGLDEAINDSDLFVDNEVLATTTTVLTPATTSKYRQLYHTPSHIHYHRYLIYYSLSYLTIFIFHKIWHKILHISINITEVLLFI